MAASVSVQARSLRCRARQPGHAGRVAGQVRGDQVGEIAERSQRPVDRLAVEREPGIGLTGERLLPGRRLALEREDLGSAVCEAGCDLGVESVAGPLAHDADRVLLAAQHALEHRVARDVNDSERQRDLILLGPAERALAVPAFGEMDEEAVDRRREREALGQHLRDLADRRQVRIPFLPSLGQPAGDLQRAGGWRAPRRRKRAHDPGQHLTLRSECRGDEVPRHRAAEDLRGHVGIRGAAGIHQQAGVVGLRGRRAVDSETVRELHCHQRAVQALLERKAHPQVGGQAERRRNLRGAHSLTPRRCLLRHAATVPQGAPSRTGRGTWGNPEVPPRARDYENGPLTSRT